MTALITGGSAGIGFELARLFAADGHDLVLVARRQEILDAAASKLKGQYGVKITAIAMDLAEPDAPQRLYDMVTADGTEIEFLVNNAGFGQAGLFAETDVDREMKMVQLNVSALVHLTKLFMLPMLRRNKGRILNLGSIAAFQPGPLMSIYYASKAFVLSFSEALSEELRNTNVTVTCLCPGATATEFAGVAGLHETRLFTQMGVASAEGVAKFGYAAMMRGQRIAIHGMGNKFLMQIERIIPRRLVTTIVRKIQENR